MNLLSAKEHFLTITDKEVLARIGGELNSAAIRSAMVFSEAIMVENGYTADEMRGAVSFRNILLNIAEKPEVAKAPPTRTLKETQQ